MLLRITLLTLAVAYVVWRFSLSIRIVGARRRGDTEREQALRRQAFWSLRGAAVVALLLVLLVLGLLGLNVH